MNMKRRTLFALLPFAALLAAAGYAPAPSAVTAGEAFSQGIITTRVSMPGNPYDQLLSKIDPAKGNVQGQLRQLVESLSPAEQQHFQSEAAKLSPAMSIGALMLPRKGTIYCRGQEARATTDALTYHLENYFNSTTHSGTLLMASQSKPERVNYTYDAASVKKTWQSIVVTDQDYTRKPTTETALVAGCPSQKITYTLKPGAGTAPGESKPVALDIWTSARIPQMLNFAHPVYVKETQGITRLVVYFDKEHKQQLVYEFASVLSKPISSQELHIATTAPVLDYAKDEMQIGMKMMGLMMGGGGPQQSDTDE